MMIAVGHAREIAQEIVKAVAKMVVMEVAKMIVRGHAKGMHLAIGK